ncbi:TerC/Alx family metal homeostasis membrane protein [Phytoactinopolyspora limicola]|uniref:TerC/Alx family metal homeostasis membrane protein n=1 Tax=Phytoactinopolyspora limicola TaxID=2715536 RepID=UPI00140B7F54
MDLPVWFEVVTLVTLTLLLIVDLLIVTRRPHEPSMRESTAWVSFYIALPIVFGILLLIISGGQASGEFFAGWVTEKSLSVDNLFVFVIIMNQFRVPRRYQQSVLMFGILLAIVMRGVFIVLGALAINQFAWVFYLFGVFLIYTAAKLAQQQASGPHVDEKFDSPLLQRIGRRFPVSADYDGIKFRTVVDGRKMLTPMLIVFVAIGSADLLFAVDSIPAIFGITQEMFLVFTANVFALMGLRQLYFLLGGLLERLVYLSAGLAVILAFIGVKLVLHALHENNLPFVNGGEPIHVPQISILVSLGFIGATLAVTTVASLLKTRRDKVRLR